jgi:regulator of nucleoside diphosphate kinase
MFSQRSVLLGRRDLDRLDTLISNLASKESSLLYDELDAAIVVEDDLLPDDVVRMNTKITFVDLDTGVESTIELVYPHEVQGDAGRVSILAPVGAALLGLRVGEAIEWPLPNGRRRRMEVKSVAVSS